MIWRLNKRIPYNGEIVKWLLQESGLEVGACVFLIIKFIGVTVVIKLHR